MVHSVRIVNFQSLADVKVDLGKLTILSGPSSSGKSAFIRAVRTLVSNPRGDYYRRHGTTETRVGLEVADPESGVEAHVNFWRAKQVRYTVEWRNTSLSEPPDEEYTAVGTSVPDPVSADLQIDPDLQITDQFDAPFLLGLTGSAVARELGVITRGDLMMRGVQQATRTASATKKEAETLAAQAITETSQLDARYGWYVDAATAFKDRVWPLRNELKDLLIQLAALRASASRLEALAPVLSASVPYVPDEAEETARLREVASALERLHAYRTHLSQFTSALATHGDRAAVLGERISEAESSIAELREQIQECPTCGQPMVVVHAH